MHTTAPPAAAYTAATAPAPPAAPARPARDLAHPVWEVYDRYRTVRLNEKYHACRLARLQRANFWTELLLAATASGSALAALSVWQTNIGRSAWGALTAASALLAIARPLLKLSERIQRLEELVTGYRLLGHDFERLCVSIVHDQAYAKSHAKGLLALIDKESALVAKEGEAAPDDALRTRCREEVERELPAAHFFVPAR